MTGAEGNELKADLLAYLQRGRDALVWKLEGLSEYDMRRPLVPTGTNLLGLVKHTASVEAGYLGETFGRPFPEPLPWLDDGPEDDSESWNADMWATAEESSEAMIDFYRRVWAHSDATVAALGLDTVGSVPWWPEERRRVTLHRVLLHMIDETSRHAGQADLVRELVDGAAGVSAASPNLPPGDQAWWQAYHDRLEAVARAAARGLAAP